MLEEGEYHPDRSGKIIKYNNNEYYTAIMDENLGRIEDMSEEYGSNFLFKIQGGAPGGFFWQGFETFPVHLAASNRRVKSLQSLLSAGADAEMRDWLGRTPLLLLITCWPSVLNTWTKPGTKIQAAEACLQLLCEHGVNVNAELEGESHQTALHLSVRYADPSAVRTLASYGADVNAVDSSGMTPLHMAAGILHRDLISSLIKEGADINMGVKHSGNTPLHLAVVGMAMRTTKTLEDDKSCVCELLEQGAEVNAVNNAGMTPLQEACSMGNTEVVDLLLRYGANINKLSKAGENCLFLFLNHRPNVNNNSLLVKLFSLTSPLTVYDQKGRLPSTLMLTCFFKQRDQLLKLIQQPRRLQDICKSDIYLTHIKDRREDLRKILPKMLYDFIFNCWENLNISFVTDGQQGTFNNSPDTAPL